MKKYFNITCVVLITSALCSCLKQDRFFDSSKDAGATIELAGGPRQPLTSLYPIYSTAYDIVPEADLPITVNYAGAQPAPEDITVTIELDPSLLENQFKQDTIGLTDEEKEEAVPYEVPDAELFTFGTTTLTIRKGEREATSIIKVKPDQFDFEAKYAIPIKIISVSSGTISGNYSAAIYAIGAKNKYDGVYTVTGTYTDISFPEYTAVYPKEIQLITMNATSVYYNDAVVLGGAGYVFNTGSGLSYYGNWSPIFNFNTSTDAVTSVTNVYGQGNNASARAGRIDPEGVNRFYTDDSGRNVLEVSYYMTQSGADRIKVTETFVYKEAR